MMIRGFIGRLSTFKPSFISRQVRLFATETAPAVGREGDAKTDAGMMRYVNGELVSPLKYKL